MASRRTPTSTISNGGSNSWEARPEWARRSWCTASGLPQRPSPPSSGTAATKTRSCRNCASPSRCEQPGLIVDGLHDFVGDVEALLVQDLTVQRFEQVLGIFGIGLVGLVAEHQSQAPGFGDSLNILNDLPVGIHV